MRSVREDGFGSTNALIAVAALASLVGLGMTFLYAPTERIEGDVQRIMYLHVPAAFTMYVGYGFVFLASIMYLWRRDSRWDEIAASAGEVGALYATVMICTGPIWAKPVWNTWWRWDGRLTSALVLWLIYMGYLMLRAYGGNPEQVARYCAVLAVIGAADIPIIHYSVRWWRGMHPAAKILTQGSIGRGLEPSMLLTFATAFGAMLLAFAVLFQLRLRLERNTRRVDALLRASNRHAAATGSTS